jgi:hypothetical protein
MAQQQQTVLRVQTSNTSVDVITYEFLDLYSSVPIKINRSYAELQDISLKNSDYSIGIQIPGSKKNNRFFESFFDVDVSLLYFNPIKKVACDILINDESYFKGYMRLNKISVLGTKVEYDISLYNTIGNLFGDIGNNLLKDLDYDDVDYTFNHNFNLGSVTSGWYTSNFSKDLIKPN